jgi:hypothetical protein
MAVYGRMSAKNWPSVTGRWLKYSRTLQPASVARGFFRIDFPHLESKDRRRWDWTYSLTCSPWLKPGDSTDDSVGVLLADTNVLSALTDHPGASRRFVVGRTWFSFTRQPKHIYEVCHTGGILQWAAYIPRPKGRDFTPRFGKSFSTDPLPSAYQTHPIASRPPSYSDESGENAETNPHG